jgi:glycosyltransferase involved in cell wall biosynthesis
MRVGFDGDSLDFEAISGVQQYSQQLLYSLAALEGGPELSFFFRSLRRNLDDFRIPPGPRCRKDLLRWPLAVGGPRVTWICDQVWRRALLPAALTLGGVEIVHVLFGFALPPRARYRRVITIHDLHSLHLQHDTSPQDLAALRRSAAGADRIVSVSELTRDDLVEHFHIPAERIAVTHNGIPADFGAACTEEAVRTLRRSRGFERPYLFHMPGGAQKNTLRAVQALRRLHDDGHADLELLLIGAIRGPSCLDDESYARLMTTIRELRLQDHVREVGYLDGRDYELTMAGAFALLFPSLWEGFGIPIVEAMRLGVPVITSSLAAMPEVAGGAALLVNPTSVDEIHDAMRRLVEDSALRADLVSRGRERSRHFDWAKTAAETHRVYRELS